MEHPLSGTVTFLFTDIEGSTRRWQDEPDAMSGALARHDAILHGAVAAHGGDVVKGTGDGIYAVFATAESALGAAIDSQLELSGERWALREPLRVRMGAHTGVAERRDSDYFGNAVNRAARVMSVAHGGQVVVSQATSELVRDVPVDLVDLGEHRLRDLGQPERIYQVVHPALQRDFPPLRSVENFATNLPLQTTTFVGRDDDMADVVEALDHSRVVTLTGVGGVGKTRLAIQVAADLMPRFPDGTWLCELGPLSDPAGLPEVVASALSIQPRQGMSMAESVVAAVREKELLVVLDNCEHLIGAAARLVDALVRSCPDVRVLATSREGLGVGGERQMTVRSLDLEGDSVQLFVDRAEEAGGGLDLDSDTASAVALICARLDGIPLALELAAARTRMMTPAEIAARLGERFRLLTGGSRTAVERHQTLRQAVDWSYDLLEPREQGILDRLGVFAGGFTLDAAETAAGEDGVDVLDGIAQLVDKSLVVAEHDGDVSRYRLLETIRQYALERLDDTGTTDTIRRRHAEWCANFMADVSTGVRGHDELRWLARLRRELDNLRAGITWAAEVDDADLALRQLGELSAMSLWQGTEGYRLCPLAVVALSTSGSADHPHAATALTMRAVDHLHRDELVDAENDAREAIRLIRAGTSNLVVEPWVVVLLTRALSGTMGPPSEELGEFLDATSTLADPYERAGAGCFVAGWYLAVNSPDEGLPYAEQAMDFATHSGSTSLAAMARFALGGTLMVSDPPRARQLLLESVELLRQVGWDFYVGMALGRIARLGTDASDPVWALQFRDSLDAAVNNDDHRLAVMLLEVHIRALLTTGREEPAALLLGYVQQDALHVTNPYARSAADQVMAVLTARLGDARLAELSSRGAAFDFAAAVELARTELDRVIANNDC